MRTIGLPEGGALERIPASHLDLAECPPVAALSTVMTSGHPQTSVVWCDLEAGGVVRVSTMRGFAKERNMRRDPRVTLLCYDPRSSLRYLEIEGTVVEMTEVGAAAHLDGLASKYAGRPIRYFGDAIPARFAETEVPILCRIRPDRVVAMDARAASLQDGCERAHTAGAGKVADRDPAARGGPPGPPAKAVEGGASEADTLPLPSSHIDLLERPICGVFTTMTEEGRPRSSLVWVDHDGACATVDTTLQRWKGRDLMGDPRASLLVVDPADTSRFIQIRGDVELVRDGAIEHLDLLTRRYTSHPAYYGHIYPLERQAMDTRVICRLHARRITLDAIHA
jgi:PPOX class probable F420-dependent enzyme